MNQRIFWLLALSAALIPAAIARQYANGQSPQQQRQAATQQQQAAFGRARAACLEGSGYTRQLTPISPAPEIPARCSEQTSTV
ncbi:MAG: hypothetical protein WBM25_05635 [Azonexus sp.]|jgi:hypothetical protein